MSREFDRPDSIQNSVEFIRDNVAYLLPHEVELMHKQYDSLVQRQSEHAEVLAEAMDQSSESWHDNAPAEAARDAANVVAWEARKLFEIARNHQIIDYPAAESTSVSIGSRVRISIGGGESFWLDIIGAGLFGKSNDNPGIEVSTYKAPIAQAILGKNPGDIVNTTIDNREFEITVLNVDQVSQRNSESGL